VRLRPFPPVYLLLLPVLVIGFSGSAQESSEPVEPTHEQRLASFLDDLARFGAENQRLNVPAEHGKFLKLMVEAADAERCLEVGTSDGYSAIWIALGLERTGGHLQTIEILPERVAEARENLQKAELSQYVTCIEGDALQEIPKLKGEFDFVFIDALKSDYIKYLELALPHIRSGAVILAHNAVSQAEEMKAYLDLVRTDSRFDTTIVAIQPRDGFAVTYYHGPQE